MKKIKDTKKVLFNQNNRKRKSRTKKHYNLEKRIKQRQRKEKLQNFKENANVKETIKENAKYFPSIIIWILCILIALMAANHYVNSMGQKVGVIGESMHPVLKNGDVVLVNRGKYKHSEPKRGDIIVFKPKGNKHSHYYMKRVIGLPGETVEILENNVFINGEKLEENYTTTAIDDVGIVKDKMVLGTDEYFVLGDDRENSVDSRDTDVGNVKAEYIYGKAWFVVSPKSDFGFVR